MRNNTLTTYYITSLRKHYSKVITDWTARLYAGITLIWNYQERWVDDWMPGYISKLRQKFSHKMPARPEHSPYKAPPRVYGAGAQDTVLSDKTAKIDDTQIKIVQQVIGGCLYYRMTMDNTILPALSVIASEQSCAT